MDFKNELRPEFLGVSALNSFAGQCSPSRATMAAGQIAQRLVIEGGNEKRILSGLESEFAKYTFSIKMPEDGKI